VEAEDGGRVGSCSSSCGQSTDASKRESNDKDAIPFRTNITPDHNAGSPGVRLTKTPCGQAYLRLELSNCGQRELFNGMVAGRNHVQFHEYMLFPHRREVR
jgi:hypothetical protein